VSRLIDKGKAEGPPACAQRRALRDNKSVVWPPEGSPIMIARMTEHEVLNIFRDSGALLEGHFILRSGLHSRQFFQCALALQQMPTVEKLGAALAQKVRSLGAQTVLSPAMGGLVIGQEVARQLGVRFIFLEK